tara:strand:- start:180 stop:449 length:270 start_codon:yes stop_codon:yes gene_type:complete
VFNWSSGSKISGVAKIGAFPVRPLGALTDHPLNLKRKPPHPESVFIADAGVGLLVVEKRLQHIGHEVKLLVALEFRKSRGDHMLGLEHG